MQSPVHDRLIDINITIPDFYVETTIRISANPCFIKNIRSLAAEIR